METSARARQCLNICQFKIGQGYVRKKKQNVLSPCARDTKRDGMVGVKKLLGPCSRTRELDQSGPGEFQDAEHY